MRWQADETERKRKIVPNGSSYKASNTVMVGVGGRI